MKEELITTMKTHADQYKALALSTGHLRQEDKQILTNMAFNTGMITERDTGWFIKLFELMGNIAESASVWEENYPFISEHLRHIFMGAYLAGYRMIEFDSDADTIEGLIVYEDE